MHRPRSPLHFLLPLIAALLSVAGCASSDSDPKGHDQPYPVLRKNIGIDLATVASFAVVGQGPQGQTAWRGGDFGTLLGGLTGSGLVAVLHSGDVSPVPLVELSNGATNTGDQPRVNAIYATPRWILMSTDGWQLPQPQEDGSQQFLQCPTITVHRPDGAMYCANIGIGHFGTNGETLEYPVHANTSGSIVFLMSLDSLNRTIVYKLQEGPNGEPSASLVSPSLHPNWMVVNGSGDLLVHNKSPTGPQGTSLLEILPVDGSAAVTVTGEHNAFAIAGAAPGPQADTFYVVSGGGGGWPFDGTLRLMQKSAGQFTETDVKVLLDVPACSGLFSLADGHYMFCSGPSGLSLARVLVGGEVQTSPKIAAFSELSAASSVGGLPFRSGGGVFYVFSKDNSGQHFARHNGVTQQDIPLSTSIELLMMDATSAGGLDFVGVDNSMNSKVRGTILPGATEVTILSAEGVSLADVVVFTRIN
jgi:hypothetical protein